MNEQVRSIGAICADLEAKGEHEAAFVLDRVANANAELGEENVELLEALERAYRSMKWSGWPEGQVLQCVEKALAKAKGETG